MPSVNACPLPILPSIQRISETAPRVCIVARLFFDLSRSPLPPSQRQLPRSQRERQETPAIRRRPTQHTHWIAFCALRVGAHQTLSKTQRGHDERQRFGEETLPRNSRDVMTCLLSGLSAVAALNGVLIHQHQLISTAMRGTLQTVHIGRSCR